MIKEATGYGSTLEEAKENAIAQLNASELDEIKIEVISMPKKKILGMFGGNSAEVKASVEVADKPQKKANKPQKPQQNKEVKEEKKEVKKEEKKEEKKETVNAETKPQSDDYGEIIDEANVEAGSPAAKAISYIRVALSAFNCKDVTIKVANKENASMIMLDGEDISIVIGRRGETLDALQYLASLAANNGGGHYKISLNIGNYREKREETLVHLANKIAAQVLKTGKNRTLEPMNPYERRIIHTAVQEIEGVESKSFGEGVGRRIVISPVGAEVRPPRSNDKRRTQNRGRQSKPQAPVSAEREPKKDTDIPLYGKIN